MMKDICFYYIINATHDSILKNRARCLQYLDVWESSRVDMDRFRRNKAPPDQIVANFG